MPRATPPVGGRRRCRERPFDCPPAAACIAARTVGRARSIPTSSPGEANAPGWRPERGLCRDCARRFRAAARVPPRHEARLATPRAAILPTPVRLGAPRRVPRARASPSRSSTPASTPIPTSSSPKDRIVQYVDITNARRRRRGPRAARRLSWHGMMTSVVACGNGRLSERLLPRRRLRGAAGAGEGRRHEPHPARQHPRAAWSGCVRNRKRYGIRIVNVSCGGDYEASYLHDRLSQAAERAHARAASSSARRSATRGTCPATPCCRRRRRRPC